MRSRLSMALVLVSAFALATSTWSAAWPAEGPRARKTSYTVLSRTGGVVRVAALEWIPPRATTVLLALHGAGAVKENSWGPMVVPGYSFGLHQYNEGRATVAIDFPGSGESEGNPYVAGVEDFAFVVDQIADLLRPRFEHVVGVGHSLGAGTVNIAQALFSSFDAIIPAALSHGGASEDFQSKCSPPNTPGTGGCPRIDKVLFSSYADRRVVEDFVSRTRAPKPTLGLNIVLLSPAAANLRALVDVPVLLLLGKNDFLYDTSKYDEEPSHYSSSPDVELVLLPRTGHAVFHHLNHGHVNKVIGTWLDRHKL